MFGKGQSRWQEALKFPPGKARTKFQDYIESVSHKERLGAAIELGRAALLTDRDGERAREIISSLKNGQFADRYLALNSCEGSRDTDLVFEYVSDRSETLKAIARKMICIYGTDAQVLKSFELCPRLNRKSFVKQLNKSRRWALVDQILTSLKDSEPVDFAALMPYGSTEFVRTHWPGIENDCAYIEWERLARNKPEYAQERMLALVDSTPEFDPRVRSHAVTVITILSKARISSALKIVESLLRICSVSQVSTQSAVIAFPARMAKLAVEHEDRMTVNFFPVFHKIEDQDLLLALLRKYPQNYGIVKILKKLPVVARVKVYEQLAPAWRAENDGVIEESILEVMPTDVRVKEAKAYLAMESLVAYPQIRMQYAAFLPWQESNEFLSPFLRDPDATLRSVAWSALIAALRYNRSQLGEVLSQIKQRQKEQDPVKQAIFEALAKLPPSLFTTNDLTALDGVIQDALVSKDLSSSTAYCIENLLLSLVSFHPEWAAKQIADFWKARGYSSYFGSAWRINDRQALLVEAQIAPVLKQWNRKEYESFVLTAASLLGKRLKVTTQITRLLREIVLESNKESSCHHAYSLLSSNAFKTLAEIVPLMLQKDSSWGTTQNVASYLMRYRQDLLTPYLGSKTHKGRFHSGKNRVVPKLSVSPIFLSAGQQKIYADALDSMAVDDETRWYENCFVIDNLAKLPEFPIKYLTRFLKRPGESQYAIQAMARLDQGNGVPLLAEALEDPALGSVAIYALRTCLLKMPANDALPIVLRAPRKQITVYKEVVRLLGDIKSEEAFAELLSIAALNESGEQPLHRDVRVAMLCAFWSHLDKDEAWKVLQSAVDDSDEVVAYTAIRTPADRLSSGGQLSLLNLLRGGLEHDASRVRLKTLERLCQMPVPDPDMKLLDAIIALLGSPAPEECRRAARALMSLYAHKSLIALPQAANAVMKKRSNLRILVMTIEEMLISQRSKLIPATYATIANLEADPLTVTLRVRLAATSMPWKELAHWLRELDAKNVLHADAVHQLGATLGNSLRPDVSGMVELEDELRNADSDVLKRVALYALEAQSNSRHGWNVERISRLESFRQDSSQYIAEVAQFILPESEETLKALETQAQGG